MITAVPLTFKDTRADLFGNFIDLANGEDTFLCHVVTPYVIVITAIKGNDTAFGELSCTAHLYVGGLPVNLPYISGMHK